MATDNKFRKKMSNCMDTVTIKSHRLPPGEVRRVFLDFGRLKNITEFHGRYFIQFENPADAGEAFKSLKKIYGVAFARQRTTARNKRAMSDLENAGCELSGAPPRPNFKVVKESTPRIKEYLDIVLKDKEFGVGPFYLKRKMKKAAQSTAANNAQASADNPMPSTSRAGEGACAMSTETDCNNGASDSDNDELPSMQYSIILANLPERYTVEDVFHLVEEIRPIAISEIDYSQTLRVKYCEVFVTEPEDIEYLKDKLDEFIICGQQLSVLQTDGVSKFKWES